MNRTSHLPWFGLAIVIWLTAFQLRSASGPLPIRGTLPWHNFLSGPTAWDDADYERYLDRMKDLGLNYLAFHCYTGGAERYAPYVEPLIRIEYRNVVPEATLDTSLTARWGYRPLAIPDFAFGTDKLFPRPRGAVAFGARAAVVARNNSERYDLAQHQMQRVIRQAHARGIQVALGFEFGIHPLEFWSIAPPGAYIRGALIPDPTHPASIEILQRTLDNLLSTYPDLDWIWLWLHEHTMHVNQPSYSPDLRRVLDRDGAWFKGTEGEAGVFTGVWALTYIRAAYDYVKTKSPRTRLAISGWGGGNQLTGVLLGLNQTLPQDIVFTCLNPDQGLAPQPAFLAEIAKNREVWAIPWLEGDASLWHLQPRVSQILSQVKLAREQKLNGVLAIHWRTEETRANLAAFARAANDPENPPSLEDFYQQDCVQLYGQEAATRLAPILIQMDKAQTWHLNSPEYFAYDPSWGRMSAEQRNQFTHDLATIQTTLDLPLTKSQRAQVTWLAANFAFALRLDEVSRQLEPAYRLKQRMLVEKISPTEIAQLLATAKASLQSAPLESLFQVYASRVRSRGELGVLSSLNQRLWLQYRELRRFTDSLSTPPGGGEPQLSPGPSPAQRKSP